MQFLDGDRVADEFVTEFSEGGSAEALTSALRRVGGVPVETEHLDKHALGDPVARAIDISAQLVADGSLERGVERGAALLVRADEARFVDEDALQPSDELISPVVRRGHVLSAAEGASEVPWPS